MIQDPQRRRFALGAASLAFGAAWRPAPSWALDQPSGEVVLTVSGRISRPNQGTEARLSREMIMALPQRSFTTATPWFVGPRRFEGPYLRDLLALVGATGTELRAQALNDYRADLPLSDSHNMDVILAMSIDGQPLRVRDKGPLFIIYNFDARPELRKEIYYARCVWQLSRLEVR